MLKVACHRPFEVGAEIQPPLRDAHRSVENHAQWFI